ncbi:MAG: tetratricopeptide repeat protein [Chromatiales bacterium]|nr:tetratricopeptide repeat protein [Chromatiales bacterium]
MPVPDSHGEAASEVTTSPSDLTSSAPTAPVGAEALAPKPVYASFDGATLNKLLVAEFAARRGQLGLAVENYMQVAEQSADAGIARRATSLALYAQDRGASLKAAEQWARMDGESSDALAMHGALLLRDGKLDEALARFNTVITLAGDQPRAAYSRITDILGRSRDRAKAFGLMERLVADHPKNLDARFALAELAGRIRNTERAAKELRALHIAAPDDERTADYLARVLQGSEQTDEALGILEAYLERRPSAHGARMTYGRILVGAARYDDAIGQFDLLTEALPDNSEVRYAYGIVLLQKADNEAAKAQFQALIDAGRRTNAANYYLGQIAETKGDEDEARRSYQAVYGGEFYLNAQIRLAILAAQADQLDDARARLQRLRRGYAGEAVRIYRAEAEILARRDDLESARRVYDEAVKSHPKDNDLLYARAMLAARADRIDDLERDLRDVLSRDPDNADALNALGYTLSDKTDRFEEAKGFIERALKLKPNDHYIVDSMGWVLHKLGRNEEALTLLFQAHGQRPDAEISAHLAFVLWDLGRQSEARTVLAEALEKDPHDKALLEALKRIGAD